MTSAQYRIPRGLTSLLVVLSGMAFGGVTRAEDGVVELAAGISSLGQKAVAFVDEHGYRNVGVLKFRVQKCGQDVSDRVGTINADLATQLETALVIYRRNKMGFGVIADANGTAAGIEGASHLSPAGRERLFAESYRLAWGNPPEKVKADAFLVGVASVAPDLQSMEIAVGAIDTKSEEMHKVGSVKCVVFPAQLVGMGESFRTRAVMSPAVVGVAPNADSSARDRPAVPSNLIHQASASAANVLKKQEPFPLEAADSPIGVTVTYDGSAIPIEVREGRAFIREPREGQKVAIKVEKKNRDGRRIGVVLKVNGENTTRRQNDPDLYCWKWILSDATPGVTVRGYHVDGEQVQPFKVLSSADSAKREMDYGTDVGTITVTVFADASVNAEAVAAAGTGDRPKPAPVSGTDAGKLAPDLALLTRQVGVGSVIAATPDLLRQNLLNSLDGQSYARGLMVPSSTAEKSKLTVTDFSPRSLPELSAVITYYTPSGVPAAK